MNGKQFEKVLDMAEENAQLKMALKDVLILLETHSNIDLLLEKGDRHKLEKARKLIVHYPSKTSPPQQPESPPSTNDSPA